MAKILLINPSTEGYGRHSIPIALISSLLKNNGHEVDLFDTTFYDCSSFFEEEDHSEKIKQYNFFKPVIKDENIDLSKLSIDIVSHLKDRIKNFQPNMICFSFWGCQRHAAGEFHAYFKGLKLVEAVKPKAIPVFIGGIIPTLESDDVINHPLVSGIVKGEGEYVYLDIANAIDNRLDLSSIDNLDYKDENCNIVKNKLRPLNYHLDKLPHADYDLFDKKSFYRPFNGRLFRFIDHEISRGCPNSCTFCLGPFQKGCYESSPSFRREKGIKKIINELTFLKNRYSLEMIRFNDESFLDMSEEKMFELAPLYRSQVGLPFIIEATIRSITEKKIICLKEMGCASVSVGIESGNLSIRKDLYNKPYFSNEEAFTKIKFLMRNGIQATLFNIVGAPTETEEMIFDTIKLNKKIFPTYTVASFYQPWKGTSLRNSIVSDGKMSSSASGDTTNMELARFQNDSIDKDRLNFLHKTFIYYVYLNRMLWPLIKYVPQNGMIKRVFDMLLKFRLRLI